MRIARQPKYTVTFAFVCDGGNTVGNTQPAEMKHSELNLALAMVDPFNHAKWMGQVSLLRRRGDKIVITMTSASDNHGTVGRAIRVVRA